MKQDNDNIRSKWTAPDNKQQADEPLAQNEDLSKQYHPAFCDAMTQIFEHDSGEYDYEREYNLNSMPNRIDFLVIKKHTDMVSRYGIGRICKRYNIFEYKSPGQQLSVNEYYLAMAYAYLYAHMTKGADIDDITISFVREGKPEKLLSYFRQKGFSVTKYEEGIYHIQKSSHIDMQVVVTRQIGEQYIWLKALSDKLTLEDAIKLANEAAKETDSQGKQRIKSILDLVSKLNQEKNWMKEMNTMGAFRDLFKEEFEEKDRQINDLNKQLQSKDEQLQNKDKEVKSLKEEIERLKKQLNKIAVL